MGVYELYNKCMSEKLTKQGSENSRTIEQLKKRGFRVETATSRLLRGILVTDIQPEVRFDSTSIDECRVCFDALKKERVAATRTQNPAIVMEIGASICSLILAVDKNDNASLIHEPILVLGDAHLEYDIYSFDKLSRIKEEMLKGLDQDSTVVLSTGLSQLEYDVQRDKIRKLLLKLFSGFDCSFFYTQNEKPQSRGSRLMSLLLRIIVGEPSVTSQDLQPDNISGMMFIPKQFTKDNQSYILFIDAGSDIEEIFKILNVDGLEQK